MTTHEARPEPQGKRAELLKIADLIAKHSGGRIRLVHGEDDASDSAVPDAASFLKIDGKRLGRDIELYGLTGDLLVGWEGTLPMFLEEVVLPIKADFPESYTHASKLLCELGETVYPAELLQQWRGLF